MLKSDEVELLYTSRNKANGENGGDEDSELETTTLVRESQSSHIAEVDRRAKAWGVLIPALGDDSLSQGKDENAVDMHLRVVE